MGFLPETTEIKNITFFDPKIGCYKVGGYCFEKLLGTQVVIDKILYYSHVDSSNPLIRIGLIDKHGREIKTIVFRGNYYIEI